METRTMKVVENLSQNKTFRQIREMDDGWDLSISEEEIKELRESFRTTKEGLPPLWEDVKNE